MKTSAYPRKWLLALNLALLVLIAVLWAAPGLVRAAPGPAALTSGQKTVMLSVNELLLSGDSGWLVYLPAVRR